jgi:hypothetical protein
MDPEAISHFRVRGHALQPDRVQSEQVRVRDGRAAHPPTVPIVDKA